MRGRCRRIAAIDDVRLVVCDDENKREFGRIAASRVFPSDTPADSLDLVSEEIPHDALHFSERR